MLPLVIGNARRVLAEMVHARSKVLGLPISLAEHVEVLLLFTKVTAFRCQSSIPDEELRIRGIVQQVACASARCDAFFRRVLSVTT